VPEESNKLNAKIFDVAHGFCSYIVAGNGNVILYDAGYNVDTGFSPSVYLADHGCTAIEWFVVSHYDEDHIADLPNLRDAFTIQMLTRNRTVSPEQVMGMKEGTGEYTPAMESMLDMMRTYNADIVNFPAFPDIEAKFFYNQYGDFLDTNNLSVVMFLHSGNLHVVYSGDLERAGWQKLLEKPEFRDELGRANIFIASHHGRESGYCEEVFAFCKPALVIISDTEPDDDSQAETYAKHATGIQWNGTLRRVLTTHQNGMITLEQLPGQTATVNAIREPARR
jgi:beta-lactamase superfamily II metal-dependent hydrolase